MVVCRRCRICVLVESGVSTKTRVEIRTDWRPNLGWRTGHRKSHSFCLLLPRFETSTQPSSVVEQTSSSKSQHPERACDTKTLKPTLGHYRASSQRTFPWL
jgi:hypothetical protein